MFITGPDEAEGDPAVADWYERQRAAWGYLPKLCPRVRHAPRRRRGVEHVEQRGAGQHGPAPLRAGHDRRGTRVPLDVLPGGALQVLARSVRRRAGDASTGRGPERCEPSTLSTARSSTSPPSRARRDGHHLGRCAATPRPRSHRSGDRRRRVAVAARAFFTKALDGLGVQADAQLGPCSTTTCAPR